MPEEDAVIAEAPWAEDGAMVCERFGVDRKNGLSGENARERLYRFGANRLSEFRSRSSWSILVDQFRSLLVALLSVAATVSFVFQQWAEGIAVVFVLIINGLIGFITEHRAVRSMEALRKLGSARVKVRRDGSLQEIDAMDAVPGDIVVVEGGDMIVADLRLIEASRLQANESTLTGESVPVGKGSALCPAEAEIADRKNMLWRGTSVTRGAGVGVVVATGLRTELGQIAELVAHAQTESTPLERRLARLGQALVWITLVLAAAIGAMSLAAGTELFLAIQTAIALAVASVPEGLPIIATLALARGLRRMAARNVLINRLGAVEALGATSVICSDKTGTLTENKITVSHYEFASGTVDAASWGSDADETKGDVAHAEAAPELRGALEIALRVGVLCNDAGLSDGGVGDPLEVALLHAAASFDMSRRGLADDCPRVREVAFDPDVKMMATVQRSDDSYYYTVKGAPEEVLAVCDHEWRDSGPAPLSSEGKRQWIERNRAGAARGLRLLGLAIKESGRDDDDAYVGLTWIGLVAMLDPARREVIPAIQECKSAGIRVIMATGDQPETALSIAQQVGIPTNHGVVTGAMLSEWQTLDADAQDRIATSDVFARVSPKQKLDLIALHQRRGDIVAMTGDGVNDAPALRKADIGVAMGQRGTDVAREAAEMVLRDDAFSSVAAAVEEGRIIFDNIRAFVIYLLSCNLSEVLVVGVASLLGEGLPLLPLQILFLNLVTDVFPALALGACQGAEDIMSRGPRRSTEPIIGAHQWRVIASFGGVMTMSVLGAFLYMQHVLNAEPQAAVTVCFVTIAFAQLFHVFNMRSPRGRIFKNEVTLNRWVWRAVALCTVLVLVALYFPPLARLLSLSPPSAEGWATIAVASVMTLVVGQMTVAGRQWLASRARQKTNGEKVEGM